MWTIADLLVYDKCPEVYDGLEFHSWDFGELAGITPLENKVVIEGGAGTGRVTLEAALTAQQGRQAAQQAHRLWVERAEPGHPRRAPAGALTQRAALRAAAGCRSTATARRRGLPTRRSRTSR